LEPINLEPTQWRLQLLDTTFEFVDGQTAKYEGEALVSEPGKTHAIQFEFKTHPLSPAAVHIPLSVSAPASVTLRANDHLVGTFELGTTKEQDTVLHVLAVNVTKETEPCRISRLGLRVSYGGEAGITTIPLGDDELVTKLGVLQEWSWRYAFQALAFFVLSSGTILGSAILVVAHMRAFGDTFRFYAALMTVAAWGLGVLGISDLAKIPFWWLLRRVYGHTRAYRTASLAALTLLFALVISGTATVIYCLRKRQHYSDLIHKAMEHGPDEDSAITNAFVLIPWRKEAQLLFERRAWVLREDKPSFRHHIREFVSQPEVKQAVATASSEQVPPFYLDKTTYSTFNDPVVWYASLLPEGEEEKERPLKETAISILSARESDAEAKILRTYLLLASTDKSKEAEIVNKLHELLTQYASYKAVAATQTYQMGCDALASYYVSHCRQREASEWFLRELGARDRQQTAGTAPLWQRPPEKLMLYRMFLWEMNVTGESVKEAKKLLLWDNYGNCEPYEKEFKVSVFSMKNYQDKKMWLKGTVFDDSQDLAINSLLNKGWRY
jgi:hypothetical protein